MESSGQTGAYIYPPICTNRLIFGKGLFHLFLSEYTNQSQNFTNLNFCDVSLLYFQDFSVYFCVSHLMFIIRGGTLVHLRIRYLTVILTGGRSL